MSFKANDNIESMGGNPTGKPSGENAESHTQKKFGIAATVTGLCVALLLLAGNTTSSTQQSNADPGRHLRKQNDEGNHLLGEIDNVAVVASDDGETLTVLDGSDERSLMMHDKNFSPLTCNAGVNWASACAAGTATTLSTLISATAPGSRVEVPCGQCAVVDYTDGSTVTIPDGINVIGKLHFPSSANVVIRTTHVIVQGIFSTDQATGALSPDDLTSDNVFESSSRKLQSSVNKVKIHLYEETTDDIFFQPHDENLNGCGGDVANPCQVKIGRKAFAVAGGLLDVNAIDPNCPAWEHLLDYTVEKVEAPLSPDLPQPTPGPKPAPKDGCSHVLLDMDFKVGDTYNNRFGGSMAVKPMDPDNTAEDNAYMSHIRNARHEGPKFTVEPTCVTPDATYFISGRARFRSKDGVTPPLCTAEGGNGGYCLEFKILNRSGYPFLGRQAGAEHKNINDGEWFDFSFPLNPMSESLIGTSKIDFWFWRPEANAIIDIDWLKIQLAPAEIFPDDTPEGCMDLTFGNGDAEIEGVGTFPWASSSGSNLLTMASEQDESGNTNRFYRLQRFGSNWGMWYKKHGFKTNCVVAGTESTGDPVKYIWRSKIRVNSDTARSLKIRFGYIDPAGKWKWNVLGDCPASSNEIGWVNCELSLTTNVDMMNSNGYQIWNWIPGEPAPYATVDYDDIFFKRSNPSSEIHKIKVSSEAATYWGVGSELLLTSSTYSQDDAHKVTVTATDPSNGVITINKAIPFTATKVQDSRFPVEVASLTRNFIIEGETNGLHGGHVIIIHTPNVKQKIEGVEFRSLGQQGSMGRYPLHFHMCDAVDGATVSKNVVKESNQRGIVIHGTHNVTVSDNVIFNIKGHGYFLEDGVEQFNKFSDNLATGIRPVASLLSSTDTDNAPSCFWMSNTMNYWQGNVCAGSTSHGFWIEPQFGDARGASKNMVDASFDRTKLNLLLFKDNDVHSVNSFGMRLYPNRWTPPEEAQIDNLRAYRNGGSGMSLHVDTNVRLLGGVYADNGHRQIWSNLADDIRLQDVEVIGLRPETRASLNRANQNPKCDTGTLHGVSFSTTRQFGGGSSTGMDFENVNFKGFDCGTNSHAIHAGDEQSRNGDKLYDAITTLNGVSFEDVPLKVSACLVQIQGVDYLSFEDVKGDLNPVNPGTPGFLVSNTELAKGLAGGSCVDLDPNTCLSYCESACLQRVTVSTDSAPAVTMKITDGSGTTHSLLSHMGGTADYTLTSARFAASLPAGTFDISYEATDGSAVGMPYTNVKIEEEPICAKGATVVNAAALSPSDAACTGDLLKNGDFESGIDGWKQFFTGLTHAVGEGVNGSDAIKTTSRGVWNSMITKYIDPNCLVAGADYDVKLSYKIVDESNNPVDCGSSCPSLSFAYYPNGAQRWMFVSGTTMPFNVGEWNTIEARFSFSSAVIDSGKIHAALFDGNRVFSGQFIVDDFTLIKV